MAYLPNLASPPHHFPLKSPSQPLPFSLLRFGAADQVRVQGCHLAVRLVFFLYDKMERVLPSSTKEVKFLNSRVVSAEVGRSQGIILNSPIRLVLWHQRVEKVSRPSCVRWEAVARVWYKQLKV